MKIAVEENAPFVVDAVVAADDFFVLKKHTSRGGQSGGGGKSGVQSYPSGQLACPATTSAKIAQWNCGGHIGFEAFIWRISKKRKVEKTIIDSRLSLIIFVILLIIISHGE